MRKIAILVAILGVAISPCAGLFAGDKDAQVKALVEQGVAMVKQQGKDTTLKAINDLKGPFVEGELYLFANSMKNIVLASGSPYSKPLIGKDVSNLKMVLQMAEIAKKQGAGWLEYSWPKPREDTPTPKKSYVMRVPGQDFYIGCGYYLK